MVFFTASGPGAKPILRMLSMFSTACKSNKNERGFFHTPVMQKGQVSTGDPRPHPRPRCNHSHWIGEIQRRPEFRPRAAWVHRCG